jgi:hypothetical protein
MNSEETFNQIQKRAYEIYLQREPNSGTPEDDWKKAELEVTVERRFVLESSRPDGAKREILWTESKKQP